MEKHKNFTSFLKKFRKMDCRRGVTVVRGILARGEGQLGEVPVGGSTSLGKCQLG